MPETVAATAGATVTAPNFEAYGPSNTPTAPGSDLGKDEFLKLLVAQLKHQDPLNPTSSDEFIATSAQFTVVEKLDELTKQGANTALINSLSTASSLLGREITAITNQGRITAIVDRSEITSGEVVLVTDKGAVGLDEVVSVSAAEDTTTPAFAPTPAATAAPATVNPVANQTAPLPRTTTPDNEEAGVSQ